jgi:uncharacterized protein
VPDVLAWYLAGPLFGLCVVAMYLLTNRRLGVSGSYLHLGKALVRRGPIERWRVWFFAGLLLGAAGTSAAQGTLSEGGYGALAVALAPGALAAVLLVGGVLIGYGARYAGGCTSGHGISGCSSLSQGSLVTTSAFFATAVIVTWAVHLLSGRLL